MEKIFYKKGVALIISVMVLGLLLLLGAYFLTFALTEFRISRSQVVATQTYYLAEAGVNEAIWKLKHDPEWKDNFETTPTCDTWLADFSRDNLFFSNSSYQVKIQNSDCGRGQITATSTVELAGGKTSQRVIKIKVFKAIGSLTGESAVFSGGSSENIDINSSLINIYDGNLFSNNNTNVSWWSEVNVYDNLSTEEIEGKALAQGNINVSWTSTLNANSFCAKNICEGNCLKEGCPPDVLSMPMIDFDSEDSNSYRNQASTTEDLGLCSVLCNGVECDTKCIYTDDEFEELLWQVGEEGTLTLNNGISYVTGPIDLKGGRKLVVNGALVADGTIDIGKSSCWTNKGQKDCGFDQITVNDPGVDKPSGLLTKAKMNFGSYTSSQIINITGLIYANDEIRFVSLPLSFTVIGGVLARKISFNSVWETFNIYLNNAIILEGVWAGPKPPEGVTPPFSPVVTIEHWEESY